VIISLMITPGVLSGQASDEVLRVYARTLNHQSASEALSLVQTLLSPAGTVELQRISNTLVVRDRAETVAAIERLLEDFDHAPRELRCELHLLAASKSPVSGAPRSPDLPQELVRQLEQLLRYNSYVLLAQAALNVREGDPVRYELGEEYSIEFELGTVLAEGRFKLRGFRLLRAAEPTASQLFYSHVTLRLEQTLALGFTRTEASNSGLVIGIRCRPADPD
jgi:hypothetical protein